MWGNGTTTLPPWVMLGIPDTVSASMVKIHFKAKGHVTAPRTIALTEYSSCFLISVSSVKSQSRVILKPSQCPNVITSLHNDIWQCVGTLHVPPIPLSLLQY